MGSAVVRWDGTILLRSFGMRPDGRLGQYRSGRFDVDLPDTKLYLSEWDRLLWRWNDSEQVSKLKRMPCWR